jgi:hypothetical protein
MSLLDKMRRCGQQLAKGGTTRGGALAAGNTMLMIGEVFCLTGKNSGGYKKSNNRQLSVHKQFI